MDNYLTKGKGKGNNVKEVDETESRLCILYKLNRVVGVIQLCIFIYGCDPDLNYIQASCQT